MSAPRRVLVRYHADQGGWWADSPDVPRWTAAGATIAEIRRLAREGVAFALDTNVEIEEEGLPSDAPAEGSG